MKRLFYDIETSLGLFAYWRPGRKVSLSHENMFKEPAIICIAYKWEDDKHVRVCSWDSGDDSHVLKEFMRAALSADELVAHNGDRFDLPWIRTRAMMYNISCPPRMVTYDTCALARRLFNFPSNSLAAIARYLKVENQKGSCDFSDWLKITLNNDEESLSKMLKYCCQDVMTLESVFERMKNWLPNKSHAAMYQDDGERWMCPECSSISVHIDKTRTTAAGTVRRQMICNDCGKYYTISNMSYEKMKERKK